MLVGHGGVVSVPATPLTLLPIRDGVWDYPGRWAKIPLLNRLGSSMRLNVIHKTHETGIPGTLQ